MAEACRVCGAANVVELLDLGPQPLCNRFLKSAAEDEYTHPMILAQCRSCGVVQLTAPVPAADLVAPYSWITNNEPEGHLDAVVETIGRLPGVHQGVRIVGVTYKDASILERFRRRRYHAVSHLDPTRDLGIADPRAGLETVQDRLGPEAAARVADACGAADVVIARHVFEHAHDPRRLLGALRRLAKPDGYVILELPDCGRAFDTLDYSTLWEEHVLYLTPETAPQCLTAAGWSIVRFDVYPYPYEDSLVIVARPDGAPAAVPPPGGAGRPAGVTREVARARVFSGGFHARRQALHRALAEPRRRGGRIAMFGAGHRACMFMNVMRLHDLIAVAVDDDPHKDGLFMPGSRVPIVGSAVLHAEDIDLCLMSLSPESEEKVMRRHQAFSARGGRFASIFPASTHALPLRDERTWPA